MSAKSVVPSNESIEIRLLWDAERDRWVASSTAPFPGEASGVSAQSALEAFERAADVRLPFSREYAASLYAPIYRVVRNLGIEDEEATRAVVAGLRDAAQDPDAWLALDRLLAEGYADSEDPA